MTYTQIAILAVAAAVIIDLFVFRTRLVRRRAFWVSYSIIFFFQLITNGMFTGFGIVQYDGAAIIGSTSPTSEPPPFLGDGRVAFAPVEDLLFEINAEAGTTLILVTHDADLAARAGRVIRLRDGRVIEDVTQSQHPSGEGA